MINSKGELETAVSDSCQNYSPDTIQPTSVESARNGVIYVCQNHKVAEERFPELVGSEPNACLICYNWQTPEGEYKNR